MEQYTLTNDGKPNVRFTGDKIAGVSSRSHQGPRQNRWTEIGIYRTEAGKYVVQVVGHTQWQGESNRFAVTVCAGEAAVIDALTQHERDDDCDYGSYVSDLAKEALAEAGIECVTEVA